jgi:hypothetical protein
VLDGSTSYDADGAIMSLAWDPGDGTPPLIGESVAHTYTNPGMYFPVLTLSDNDGKSHSWTLPRVLVNDPQCADGIDNDFDVNRAGIAGDSILLRGWSHDEESEVFPRGPGPCGPNGVRTQGRVRLGVGGD